MNDHESVPYHIVACYAMIWAGVLMAWDCIPASVAACLVGALCFAVADCLDGESSKGEQDA